MFSDCSWLRVMEAMEGETTDGGDYCNWSTRGWRANMTGGGRGREMVQGGAESKGAEDIGADGDGLKQTTGNS